MSFFHPWLLWLAALPVLLFTLDLARRAPRSTAGGKILTADAGPGGLTLTPPDAARRARARWRLCLGLVLAAVALARPQWGRLEEPVFDQSREIIVAIDLSRSMLADDIKPSRLDRARLLTQSLLENTPGERVGLIVFAGTAFLQSPLSADHEIIRDFLPLLDPDFLPAGGTDYRALLATALDAFSDSAADRFLVILSDGEADRDDWRALAETARERDIRILTLGIGTPAGAMLPDGEGGFIKDQRGAVVLSKLDDTTLRELARITDGVHTDASQWVDLAALVDATVAQGRAGEFKETGRVRLAERYQWALAPALLLLLWSLWREFPARPASSRVGRLRHPAAKSAAALALLLATFTNPPPTFAADAPPARPSLPELVADLSSRATLSADDYARLAETTLDHGNQRQSAGQPTPAGLVRDGLEAVHQGRRLAPAAADWDQLKTALEQLQQPPPKPEPPPSADQQQQPDQSKKDSEKSDEKSDSSGEGQPSDSPDQPPSDQTGQSDTSQNQDRSPDSSEQAGDQKSDDGAAPGEQPRDDQRKPGEQAFGDMTPSDDEPQPSPAPAPADEPADQPPESDTQSVGGVATDQPPPTDPALLQTLQRLERLKSQDSPARLFQLLQDPNPQSPAATGQTW